MKLTELSGKYGAPMGRHDEGDVSDCDDIAIEWMPFVDGAYDCQGAYWGGGDPMYCIVGYDEDGEEVAREYGRFASREEAWEYHDHQNPSPVLRPETGSIVKQTIEKLQEYQAGLSEEEEAQADDTRDDIYDLEGWLEERGLT